MAQVDKREGEQLSSHEHTNGNGTAPTLESRTDGSARNPEVRREGQGSSPAAPTPQAPPPATGNTGAPTGGPKAARPPWVKTLLIGVLLVALVFGGIWGVHRWQWSQVHVSTDDAYLTTDVVQITPQVNGNIAKILVKENQQVQKGQLLAVLDDATYRAEVAQAQANLAVARAGAVGATASTRLTQGTGNAQVQQALGGLQQAASGIGSAQADVLRSRAGVANSLAGVGNAIANVGRANANIAQALAARSRAGQGVNVAQTGIAAAVAARTRAVDTAKAATAAIGTAVAARRAAAQTANAAQAGVGAAIAARDRAIQAITAAQAQVATAQAGVRSAEAGVTSAEAQATRATQDAARYAELYRGGAVSAQQVDAANAAATAAEAQLSTARQGVTQAQETVTARQADVASAQEQVRAANAGITQAQAQAGAAQSTIGQADAAVRQAQAQRLAALDAVREADAMVNQNRAQRLASEDAVREAAAVVGQNQAARLAAQQTVRQAQATVGQNRATVLASQQGVQNALGKRTQALGQLQQARTVPGQVAVSTANERTAAAKIQQAMAALRTAEINLADTRIVAPLGGQISKKTIELGQQVAIGQPLMSIVPNNDVWVVANFKETQLKGVEPGERAEIEVDAFPGHTFTGQVNSIAAATGATFSLLPPENASGNFTKVVQRVPVKILFDRDQPYLEHLRGGLSVVATITLRH